MDKEIIKGNTIIESKMFEGYRIFDGGRVIGKKGKFIKSHKGTCGYFQLNTWRDYNQKTYLIHRIVATLFVPNPLNLPEVNHEDGNKENNWSWNLKWVTRPQNIQHGFKNGLITPSQLGKTGILSNRGKVVIQLDNDGNEVNKFGSTLEAERETGINSNHIQDVCRGKGISASGYKWSYQMVQQSN